MHYDFIIVGSGMVGATLACALPEVPIALIDQADTFSQTDHRLLALTEGSCHLLKQLALWEILAPHATRIEQIHISKKNAFGSARVTASELDLSTLGYLIPAKYINQALEKKLQTLSHVTFMKFTRLTQLLQTDQTVAIKLQKNTGEEFQLIGKQLIGADGTQSTVRQLLDIKTSEFNYDQMALVTITELQRSHQHIAYERFLHDTGAIAMLPLGEQSVATIWTDKTTIITELMALSSLDFVATLQKTFGYRLGKFLRVKERYTYPLKFILSKKAGIKQVRLIGNALHTMHPLGAQGLNLALYEVAKLAAGDDSSIPLIRQYFSHQLYQLFSNDFFLLHPLRQLGLIGFDIIKPTKTFIMDKIMGRSGKIPVLLQGNEN